jgi:geranylgeranyl diphosphate synthase type I
VAFSEIKALIEALPGVAAWPELASLFDSAGSTPRPDWELPLLACKAVGGDESVAQYAAAAIACLQISILLVDDILDDDQRGAHHLLGEGQVANMALAYESAAMLLGGKASLNPYQKGEIIACLAKAALETAAGQQLDVLNLQGEEDYWAVISAKSTPFYGAALQVGALAGDADLKTSEGMYKLGVLIGEMIQLEDDLIDALEKPANADWNQGRNNLLIMFARTAEHRDRDRFLELLPLTNDPEALAEAQSILITSGAVSYCAYQLVHRQKAACKLLSELNLEYPDPLSQILADYANTLRNLLQISGIELSISDLATTPSQ